MSWVRRDDQASIHRKVAPLDDATYRLWSEAIEWCSRSKTDGRIAADELGEIKRGTRPRAAKLVARGLWHAAGTRCDSPKCAPSGPDGWVIHDYLDYNPSRAKVLADRAATADRVRNWRQAQNGAGNGVTEGVSNASGNALLTPPPSRPVPDYLEGRTDTTGQRSTSDEEPSPRCPTHIDDPSPPPCGACAEARRAFNRWLANRSAADVAARQRAAHDRADAARAAIAACPLCDDRGYRGTAVCDHDPATPARTRRGAAAARAALTERTTP